jgi:hypothetical protein
MEAARALLQSRMISRMMMMIRVPIPMYMRGFLPLAL